MGSSGKKRTTMAKLNREQRLRDRRMEKQMKKEARQRGELDPEPDAPQSDLPGELVALHGGKPIT
jgi:hypothetical protein